MVHVTDEEFKQMVQEAVRAIPKRFASHLDNVAFMVADEPSQETAESRRHIARTYDIAGSI